MKIDKGTVYINLGIRLIGATIGSIGFFAAAFAPSTPPAVIAGLIGVGGIFIAVGGGR